jgi:DNA-binding response OmpR family regulator
MIKRIRKKLSDYGSTLRIETVRGFGYKIEDKE